MVIVDYCRLSFFDLSKIQQRITVERTDDGRTLGSAAKMIKHCNRMPSLAESGSSALHM
jgi:hypothetical protein